MTAEMIFKVFNWKLELVCNLFTQKLSMFTNCKYEVIFLLF